MPGHTSLTPSLTSALARLGVTVLLQLPDFVRDNKQVMPTFVQFPTDNGVAHVLRSVSPQAVQEFNAGASAEEKLAIVRFICNDQNFDLPSVAPLLSKLQLFSTTGGKSASIEEVRLIAPPEMPPLIPTTMLVCNNLEQEAAKRLGAEAVSLKTVVVDVLQIIQSHATIRCSQDQITSFMQYVLNSRDMMEDPDVLDLAKNVTFVPTPSGGYKRAEDLYDPTFAHLQILLQAECGSLFPHNQWRQEITLRKLRKLGLRNALRVKSEDLIRAAWSIQALMENNQQQSALQTSQALWQYLLEYGDHVSGDTLQQMANYQCLPCLQDKPSEYPTSLPLKSDPQVVKPCRLAAYMFLPVVGSATPIAQCTVSSHLLANLKIIRNPVASDVLQHLHNVTQCYRKQEAAKFKYQLNNIFELLHEKSTSDYNVISFLQEIRCVPVGAGDTLVQPGQVCMLRGAVDLEPYRFVPQPLDCEIAEKLLVRCGGAIEQDDALLLQVLREIQQKYENIQHAHQDYSTDLRLVKHILEKLLEGGKSSNGTVLLPVVANIPGVLRFRAAGECTVTPVFSRHKGQTANDTYNFVLEDVDPRVAVGLGALWLSDRALTGVENLDYEYDDYEQDEDLTTRLHGLLNEAYTDGFSVPKELVQNADDAGAREIRFLLDERENPGWRSGLMHDTMASLQGPAIWAYNDAVFSDADFSNIVRLGAGTKKEDVSKVGRFGLGFNAVYNLTEVPCFLSRHWLAMFDPQRKYLQRRPAGMKLNFRKLINKDLLLRYPYQFLPFRNVFGCEFRDGLQVNGTLFRFPLRTAEQAASSALKKENYTPEKKREFLKMLLEKAGSVLMFTQNVQQISVFHLPENSPDPSGMKCLLTVEKASVSYILIPVQTELTNQTIMQYYRDKWGSKNKDVRLIQQVRIRHTVTQDATAVCGVNASDCETHWKLAWASGVGRSADMALDYLRHEGLVPVAAVAMSLDEGGLKALRDGPPGFYTEGHLYCFLPLPEQTSKIELPVHINGVFALKSDRRGLLVQTEDDFTMRGSGWNAALYGDAVCRAYCLLLEFVRKEASSDADFGRFFSIWPSHNGIPALVENFYPHLKSAGSSVFPIPYNVASDSATQWVSFDGARFLDVEFRDNSTCGMIAWYALQKFWNRPGSLVDVPTSICRLIQRYCGDAFNEKVVTELSFYTEFVFPNLNNAWWKSEQRDTLILHAVLHKDQNLQNLVKKNACIPCEGRDGQLKKPAELVSPHGKAASLYLELEGHFPQGKKNKGATSEKIDFCRHDTLTRLIKLGMTKDFLPWHMLVERVESVQRLMSAGVKDEALKRASRLIMYLSECMESLSENCPSDVKDTLSRTPFLPVMCKPKDWPFKWAGGADGNALASPAELSSDKLANLVGCSAKLLDTKALELTGSGFLTGKPRDVLRWLGVTVEKDYNNIAQMKSSLVQLLTVSACSNLSDINRDQMRSVSMEVYEYLATRLNRDNTDTTMNWVSKNLSNRNIIFTRNTFSLPIHVAFASFDCSPYLFQLESDLQSKRFKSFFEAVGVRDKFEAEDVLVVMGRLKQEHGERQLPENALECLKHLAGLLESIVKRRRLGVFSHDEQQRVFLPNQDGVLQEAKTLCINDCKWLSGRHVTVHGCIAPDTALLLGVTTKRKQDFTSRAKPIKPKAFGQKEKLTTRIRRLLSGYTFDSSLFMELLQNADDAGATDCKLIMDFRRLGTKKIPENWEVLQGPALCFYNNKSFTSGDIEGIQNLGEGSKGDNALKTGQFGVGFNAVFHVTDVPSFWTKVDDKEETICIFDPNGRYVPETEQGRIGAQFPTDMIHDYPDMLAGYLGDMIDKSQPGTLFRFPLRNEKMAERSEIKRNEVVSDLQIRNLLDDFRSEMGTSLMFLNNLQTVGIYQVTENGTLHKEFSVQKTLDEQSSQSLCRFKYSLELAAGILKGDGTTLGDIKPQEEVVQCKMTNSDGDTEEWLTVHRVGFTNGDVSCQMNNPWKQILKLLPRGGVAVKISEHKSRQRAGEDRTRYTEHGRREEGHRMFCILPLPIKTNLPMHVNGHFVLDHETRRNLWGSTSQEKDSMSMWNDAVAQHIIVPAYTTALLRVRHVFLPAVAAQQTSHRLVDGLRRFHDLFPSPKKAPDDFWKNMVHHLYRTLAEEETAVFPVVCRNGLDLEWVPVVKRNGFPGFFEDLVSHYRPETAYAYRSAGFSYIGSHTLPSKPDWYDLAKEMKAILKSINMKVLETPISIRDFFKESGVQVQLVTPDSVLQFLRSARQMTHNGCNLSILPKPVSETPLGSSENTKKLMELVSKAPEFLKSLNGLPLCLRESGSLHVFSTNKAVPKPIMSEFSYLLPASAEEFLNQNLLRFFTDCEETWAVLQKLTIPMFAERLQQTLPDPRLSAAVPLSVDLKGAEWFKQWLQDFWKFLQEQFTLESAKHHRETLFTYAPESRQRQQAEHLLTCLNNWCLVPTQKNTETVLYPIADLHKIVYLPHDTHHTNKNLCDILTTMPIPFLDDTILHCNSLARNLVASISYPRALLHALASCADHLTLSHSDGQTILEYFNSNLDSLKSSCQNSKTLRGELKRLPVFPSVGGGLTSLNMSEEVICISSSIPENGLAQWAIEQTHPVCLLRSQYIPTAIKTYLGFRETSDEALYAEFLLPSLNALPYDTVLIHMSFLRGHFKWGNEGADATAKDLKELRHQLKRAAFIKVRGSLYTADNFVSPFLQVFTVMCPEKIPPNPFGSSEWKDFMIAAGMISAVTAEMYLGFVTSLSEAGQRQGLSDDVKKKSRVLTEHLYQRTLSEESRLVQRIKKIPFLLPSDWQNQSWMKLLTNIAAPVTPLRLVSFAESCSERDLYLVWSSSVIIHPSADPREKRLPLRLSDFGIREEIPEQKVLTHIANVTQSLSGANGQAIFRMLPVVETLLTEVMEALYGYFMKNLNVGNTPFLASLHLVCDIEKRKMFKASNVVHFIDEKEEAIRDHIEAAPTRFGKFFPLFEKLGMKKRVSANHYAMVLQWLKHECDQSEGEGMQRLNPNEGEIAKKAVRGLFRCLEAKDTESQKISVHDLFLLDDQLSLKKSTNLVFKDSNILEKLTEPPRGLFFFISFNMLGMSVLVPRDEALLLPRRHRMLMLTDIVREVVPQELSDAAFDGELSLSLIQRISNPSFVDAVVSLVYASYAETQNQGMFSREVAESIQAKLSNIHVKEVANFHTVFIVQDHVFPGNLRQKVSFTQTIDGDPRMAVVYVDTDAWYTRRQQVIRSFAQAVMFVINVSVNEHHLISILENPDQAMEILDELGVVKCNLSNNDNSITAPVLGEMILQHDQIFLIHALESCNFKKGDYVGVELYDPMVDEVSGENGGNELYILYGRVVEEITDSDALPFQRIFRVYLGPEIGYKDVSVTKMYMFVRRKIPSQSRELVEDLNPPQASASEYGQAPTDMHEVLRDIRRSWRDAWQQLATQTERKRVLKRLLLKWHPEKNRGNENFCNEVTKKILEYFDILEGGGNLPENDDEVDGTPRRPASNFASNFFFNMNARARSYRAAYEDYESFSSRPCPHPGQAKRWMRQAQADLDAALISRGTLHRGRNWICYMCHQSAEKALKAAQYAKDANVKSQSHDLVSLVSPIGDPCIRSWACDLEHRVGPHIRMRYPDAFVFPTIPSDQFTEDDVNVSCRLAAQILERVQALL